MMVQGVIDVAVNDWIDSVVQEIEGRDIGGAWTDQVQAAD